MKHEGHWTDSFFVSKFGPVLATCSGEATLKQVDFIVAKTGFVTGKDLP